MMKHDQETPGQTRARNDRRAMILARRNKYGRGTSTAAYFAKHRYVPGNGPNHKLGREGGAA
jgi:hypothetical protein